MTRRSFSALPPDVIATAAEWFARLQEEDLCEQDFIEWQRWMAAHPDHQRAYRDMEETWRLIGEAPVPRARPQSGFVPRALAAMFVLVTVVAVAWFAMHEWTRVDAIVATATAEQRSIRLEDGTRVMLGAESELQHRIDTTSRRVRLLKGEAFFQVAHDPTRPFVVSAGGNEIRALGTAFNVLNGADRVVVTVAEGKVQVERAPSSRAALADSPERADESPVLLVAGERAASDTSGIRKLAAIEANTTATWRVGRLEYLGEPLRHVLEDVARYTDRELVLADDSLGTLGYTGTVFTDHIDEWLEGVAGVLPIEVREAEGRVEISERAALAR